MLAERTRQKEAELHKLLSAVEQSPVSIVMTDPEGTIEYVNPFFCEVTGYSVDEAVGKNPRILKSGCHDTAFYKTLWNTITSGKTWRSEMCNQKKSGDTYWEQVSISPVLDRDGGITHYIAVKEDISERKELERLKEDVERMMRHDLKSPLNAIVGFPQILLRSRNLSDHEKEYCHHIETAGKQMLDMINLHLDLFKMETGSYTCVPEKTDITEVVAGVMVDMQPKAENKKIRLLQTVNHQPVETAKNVYVKGDKILCYSALSNQVKNAVEASPENQPVVVDMIPGNPDVIIRIQNQGAVPEDIRHRFFEKYTTAGKHEGTGLGTYSAKLMIETQGGAIDMKTSEEEGTTITVTLPALSGLTSQLSGRL